MAMAVCSTVHFKKRPEPKKFWPLPDRLPDDPGSSARFDELKAKWAKADRHKRRLSDPLEEECAKDLFAQQMAGASTDETVAGNFRELWRRTLRQEGDTSLVSQKKMHEAFKARRSSIAWTLRKENICRVKRFWEKHAKAKAAAGPAKEGMFAGVSSYAVERKD